MKMAEDLYDILKVPRGCSPDELKKSYKKLCIQHHPDKGGDENEFKRVSEAYNVLKDPEKRKTYDQFGLEGLQNGGMPNMQSMMETMFKRQGGGGSQQKTVTLELSLEDIFNGNPQYIYKIQRKIIDPTKQKKQCNVCCGKGFRVMQSNMGFMNMQQKVSCPQCQGACFENIHELYKTIQEDISLHIPQNCPENHQFILKNRMDEQPNGVSGDIVLVVKYIPHPVFYRLGNDLLYTLNISFQESLFGFQKTISLLDKSSVEISFPSILKWNEMLVLPGKGLFNHSSKTQSDLFIGFKIDYPTTLTEDIKSPQYRILTYSPSNMKRQIADPSFYLSRIPTKSPGPSGRAGSSSGFPGFPGFPGSFATAEMPPGGMECNQQ